MDAPKESHGYNFRKITQEEFDSIELWYRAQLAERFKSFDDWRITIDNCGATGTLGFVVLWGVSDSWANVSVFEVEDAGSEILGEDIRLFLTPSNGMNFTDDIRLAAPYIDGHVKWDGCSELDQGCPHWCGPANYKAHIVLLEFIYRRAMDLMGRGDGELPWDEEIGLRKVHKGIRTNIVIGPKMKFSNSDNFGVITLGPDGAKDVSTGQPPMWAKE